MNVMVIGSGYVGLVGAVGFAHSGHAVLGVDVDEAKVARMSKGESPIYEPGLDALLQENLAAGRLRFSTRLEDGIRNADAAYICVGTPQSVDGSADLQYVLQVAHQIGEAMRLRPAEAKPLVVVDKSTVPVGTAARVREVIASLTDRAFEVISSPEFLREGCAIDDFMKPDRVVVGCETDHAEQVMRELHAPFLAASGGRFIRMNPESSELTKYAANAMLALRISFMNEIAALCELVGADVDHVREGIGSDRRIGPYFLNPGPGFGGSCFPKDLQALLKVGRELGHSLQTLTATVEVNRHQKQLMARKVRAHYGARPGDPNPLKGRRFALWGLAFKAHTDDIREAMSLELIETLTNWGATLAVHDFEAMPNVKSQIGNRVEYAEEPLAACEGADALIIATEWPQYAQADLSAVANHLKARVLFDGRNLFRPEAMASAGWTYHSIGRRPVLHP